MKYYTKRYQAGAAVGFVDQKLTQGIYSFPLDELTTSTGLSIIAARNQLLRMGERVVRVMPRQPYFLIVTPDQRVFGAPPVDRWLDDYFRWMARPYYLALLSAAAAYGSSQQAIQVVDVMTDRPLRPITLGRVRIRFFMKSSIGRTFTQKLPLAYAPLTISTVESTIFDLIRYAPKIGGIERAAETISPLLGEVTVRRLAQALGAENEVPTAQRLGFVLESLGAAKLAAAVRKWLPGDLHVVPLATHAPRHAGDQVCEDWGVLVNSRELQR